MRIVYSTVLESKDKQDKWGNGFLLHLIESRIGIHWIMKNTKGLRCSKFAFTLDYLVFVGSRLQALTLTSVWMFPIINVQLPSVFQKGRCSFIKKFPYSRINILFDSFLEYYVFSCSSGSTLSCSSLCRTFYFCWVCTLSSDLYTYIHYFILRLNFSRSIL